MPLFALANAGITVNGSFLARAYTSPVTLGILLGYVAGKPAGTVAAARLLTRLSRGGSARRSAGPRSPAPGPSPASVSPCRC